VVGVIGVQTGVTASSMPMTNASSAKLTTSTGELERTKHLITPALWI
jgi:hypothetical protein